MMKTRGASWALMMGGLVVTMACEEAKVRGLGISNAASGDAGDVDHSDGGISASDSGASEVDGGTSDTGEQPMVCAAEDAFCYGEQHPCCPGLFCGLDPNTYGQGSCQPLGADGESCASPEQCLTGFCTDGLCGAPVCGDEGAFCYPTVAECCAGSFCSFDLSAYGSGTCTPLLEDGEACEAAHQCQTGQCSDGLCGEPLCDADGEYCSELGCCPGLFCDPTGGAYAAACAPLRAVGDICLADLECASGRCVDDVCLDGP